MKALLTLVLLAFGLNAMAEDISPKLLNFDCGSSILEGGFFRTTKNKVDYMATVDKGHPLLVGEPLGSAKVTKLRADTYKLVVEVMTIVPWSFTEYWDELTVIFNTKSQKLSYKLAAGYDSQIHVEDSKACGRLYIGPELEEVLKKL